MKGGLAAALVAARRIAEGGVRIAGDLLVAGCIDEEWASAGAVALAASHPVDAVILPEQTNLELVTEHGGFAWFEIESRGSRRPGSSPIAASTPSRCWGPCLAEISALDASWRRGRARRTDVRACTRRRSRWHAVPGISRDRTLASSAARWRTSAGATARPARGDPGPCARGRSTPRCRLRTVIGVTA